MKVKKKRSVLKFIFLSVISVFCLCTCMICYALYTGKNEIDRTQEYMMDVTEKSAIAVNDKIEGYLSSLQSLSAAVSSYDRNLVIQPDMLKSQLKLGEFRRIGYIYADGESYLVDNELGPLTGFDLRERDYFKASMNGDFFVADPFRDFWSEHVIVVISVPFYDNDGKIAGVLFGVNYKEDFTRALEDSFAQRDAYFHIVDRRGNMVIRSSHADQDLYSPNVLTAEYEKTDGFERIKSDFEAGKSGIASFKEYGKNKKYVAYVPLKFSDWYIASIISADTATQKAKELVIFTTFLMAILGATVLTLSLTALKIRQKGKEEAYKLAFEDELTGCRNKAKFLFDLQNNRDLYHGNYYLCVYDLQHFSIYNKIFGYTVGDELIIGISRILKKHLNKKGELLAHSYADCFLLLISADSSQSLNQRLEEIFQSVDESVRQSEKAGYSLISCFGIYQIQPNDKALSHNALIDYANQARNAIGEAYKNSYHYYDSAASAHQQEEALLESHMHTALENHEFLLYLQPKYEIQHEQPVLCGAECLVRWNYKGERLIPPDRFIPKFEQNGFITELDMHMLEQSCRLLRSWLDRKIHCIPLSVNQSRLHMFSSAYLSQIVAIVDRYQIPHELLEFEITESALMSDISQVREQFRKLRKLGFKTSMDDFGSGFSSLNLLKDIDADIIKIDKGFFSESFHSENGRYIVKSIVTLVKKLGYHVIAEGIETKDQVLFLKECGCDCVQGYYYGKPQPTQEFEKSYLC